LKQAVSSGKTEIENSTAQSANQLATLASSEARCAEQITSSKQAEAKFLSKMKRA
jgi:hypothetical protein